MVDYYSLVLKLLKENKDKTEEELAAIISKEIRKSIDFEMKNFLK